MINPGKQVPSQSDESKKADVRPGTSTIRKDANLIDAESNTRNASDCETHAAVPSANREINIELESDNLSHKNVDNDHISQEDNDSYEDDFEDSTSTDDDEHDLESDSDESEDEIESVNKNDNESSGLIRHPTIVKRQSGTSPTNVDMKVKTKFLQMSNRSSTFVKTVKTKTSVPQTTKKQIAFVNFAKAAEQESKKKVLGKLVERAKELFSFMQIHDIEFDNIELPPMQYDVYMNRFGKVTAKQVFTLTEPRKEEIIQTDEIEVSHKGFQVSWDRSVSGIEEYSMELQVENSHSLPVETSKLHNFIHHISPIMSWYLSEISSIILKNDHPTSEKKDFSHFCHVIRPNSLCNDIPVIFVSSSPKPTTHFLAIYGDQVNLQPSSPDSQSRKGMMSVWNCLNITRPEYTLASNSQPTCASFAPYGYDMVIAGMVDGSIVLWDLNERLDVNGSYIDHITARSPTYSTAVMQPENHYSCVVSIQTFQYQNRAYSTLNKSADGFWMDRSYHVLSLDEMGKMNIWIVVDVPSGMDSDLGLAPGGKVKLVWSTSISLKCNPLGRLVFPDLRTFDFDICQKDGNHILVTADEGLVLHVVRSGTVADPKHFLCATGYKYEVKCIDFSPHNPCLFLVGCSDGCSKLFNIKRMYPVSVFTHSASGASIRCIQWTPHCPVMFFALDILSDLYIWDIMSSQSTPKLVSSFSNPGVLWFNLYECSNAQVFNSNATSVYAILGKENGDVDLHCLHQDFSCSPHQYESQMKFISDL